MRTLLLVAALMWSLGGAGRADVLANGDFASGSAHWDGDRQTNSDSTFLTIPLKPASWAKISQIFHSTDAAMKVHITYSLSDDCTFLPKNGMAGFFLSDGVVQDITGLRVPTTGVVQIKTGGFLSIIVDPAKRLVSSAILDGGIKPGSQSTEGFFYDLTPHAEKMFYLAFPPGKGTVTLTHLALDPAPNGPTRDQAPTVQ